MAKDFRGQDLRGRSFKGQDLTGADFSECDLRGVDFSWTNLTGAIFYRAKMGRTKKADFALFLFQPVLIILSCFFAAISNIFIIALPMPIFMAISHIFSIESGKTQAVLSGINICIFYIIILIAILKKRIDYLWWFIVLLIVGDIIAILVTGGVVILAITLVSILFILFVFSEFIRINKWFFTFLLTAVITGLMLISIKLISVENINKSAVVHFVSAAIYVSLGIYLGCRAIKKEESHLLFLRELYLKMACLGSTQFAFAILHSVDFLQTDLKYARFINAKIIRCRFQQAKNHHLALTNGTPLEMRRVRDLITDSIITDKNFSTLDLRGLDFSNLNLQGFDFSHANLSGANLSHTQMTGAILEGWAIDTETRLDDIECSYYYYLENGDKKRMPPEGEEYKAGEFTRIFQKIANTIDFIAHNEMELAAIKLSVEQVRVESGNDDIRVQAIEEKDGFIVVKVTAPKTEDRGVLYHEINVLKHEYEAKIQLLNATHQGKIEVYQEQINRLENERNKKRNNLIISIKNSIINNDGIFILGETNGDNTQHKS